MRPPSIGEMALRFSDEFTDMMTADQWQREVMT